MKPSHSSIVTLRRILLGAASVATLLAVFITEENWRGDRAWALFEQEMRARGEPLYYSELQHPSVPDEQNLFKTPLLSRLLYDHPNDGDRRKLIQETGLTKIQFWKVNSRKDLSAFAQDLKNNGLIPAASTGSAGLEILRAMDGVRPVLDEIRLAALSRPLAALEPRPTPISKGIAADTVWALGQALALRALAELDGGLTADAFADTSALQRLGNALSNQPDTLLNLLIGVSMHGLAAGVYSEGCDEHAWSATQLVQFQENFHQLNPLLNFREALRKERASVLYAVDLPSKKEFRDAGVPFWLFHGWLQQNKLAYCRDLDASTRAAFTIEPPRVFVSKLSSPDSSIASKAHSPFRILAHLAIPNIQSILAGLGNSVDKLTLKSVGCSIEHYRLVNGRYPRSLDELTPAFLSSVPCGIIDGQPMRYSEQPPGSYDVWFGAQK